MDIQQEDYIKFYWVLYYCVRAKYFPNDTWIEKKIKDKSPNLWLYDMTGKRDELGRLLFGRAAKYIYTTKTLFNEQKRKELDVDNTVLIAAFNLIGCTFSEEERQAQQITIAKLPKAQFSLFKEKYQHFLQQYPDLKETVEIDVNTNLGRPPEDNFAKDDYLEDTGGKTNSLSDKSSKIAVEKSKLSKREVTQVIESASGESKYSTVVINEDVPISMSDDTDSLQTGIVFIVDKFMANIKEKNYIEAANAFYPDKVKIEGFALTLFTSDISEYSIFDVRCNQRFVGENHATCLLYYRTFENLPSSQLIDECRMLTLSELDIFIEKIIMIREKLKDDVDLLKRVNFSELLNLNLYDHLNTRGDGKYSVPRILPEKLPTELTRLFSLKLERAKGRWYIVDVFPVYTHSYHNQKELTKYLKA